MQSFASTEFFINFISPTVLVYTLSYFISEELLDVSWPNVTITIWTGGGNCILEGLRVLFKAAELVHNKTSLNIGFPDS